MATEEIIFKISADSSNANKESAKLESKLVAVNDAATTVSKSMGSIVPPESKKSMQDILSSTDSLDSKLQQLNTVVAEAPVNLRAMNKQIQSYQALALEAGVTSPIGMQALQQASQLTDRLTDVRNQTNRLADDQKNLKGVMELGSTMMAGYGAFQGVMALTGESSEAMRKTMMKLQAVQTVLISLDQIKTALQKESNLMLLIGSARTKVMAVAQVAWTAATAGTTAAMGVLRLAMLAVPIIAIIVAMVALIGWIASLFSETEKAEDMNNAFNASMERSTEALERNSAASERAMSNRIRLAKAQGESTDEINKLELEQLTLQENNRVKELQLTKEHLFKKKVALETSRREENYELSKTIKGELDETIKKFKDLRDLDGQYYQDRKVMLIEQENKAEEERKRASEKANANWKSANEARKRKQEEANKLELERIRLMRDMVIANIQDEDLQKMTMLKETHSRQREELIKKYGEDTMLKKQLTIKQIDEEAKLIEETNAKNKAAKKVLTDKENEKVQKAFDKVQAGKRAQIEGELIQMRDDFEARQLLEAEFAKFEMDQALLAKDLTEGEKLKIDQQYKQKIAELEKQASDRTLATEAEKVAAMKGIYESGFSAISSLSEGIFAVRIANAEAGSAKELELQKKAFKFNKKMQIAQATIAGIQGVQAAFTTASASPLAAIPGYAIGMAAAAGAQALGNILKIKATTFQGGGSVGGGGGGSVTPPSIGAPNNGAVAPNSDTTTLTGGLSGGQGIKVTLVDSEVKQALTDSAKVDVISMVG